MYYKITIITMESEVKGNEFDKIADVMFTDFVINKITEDILTEVLMKVSQDYLKQKFYECTNRWIFGFKDNDIEWIEFVRPDMIIIIIDNHINISIKEPPPKKRNKKTCTIL